MRFFEEIELIPPDSILGLNQAFLADPRKQKVNLGVGAYKTAELKPLILESVKKVEKLLLQQETSKDYLPIDGDAEFITQIKKLIFGSHAGSSTLYGAQTVGATAALRVGGAFLKKIGFSNVFISDPTWDNHRRIFEHADLAVSTYPYYNAHTKAFDFKAFCLSLEKMEAKSIILMQPCCHNPTGLDPTLEQWEEIFDRICEKQLFPFFDFAYQGFGVGCDEDAASIRSFVSRNYPYAVAVSYAKNFGLYGERTGALFLGCMTEGETQRVASQIRVLIRGIYSNPPCHGARIVANILKNEELKHEWLQELAALRYRITAMRYKLFTALKSKSQSSAFDVLQHQRGMFSYTGLQRNQVEQLMTKHGIYMTKDGRINVAGLNDENIEIVADAIVASL